MESIDELQEGIVRRDEARLDQIFSLYSSKFDDDNKLPIKLKDLRKSLETILTNPMMLLEMPHLNVEDKASMWLKELGISDGDVLLTLEEFDEIASLSPGVRDMLVDKNKFSIKELLTSVRFEYAKQVFSQRKFNEANDLIGRYISDEMVVKGPVKIATVFDYYPDYYSTFTTEGFNGGYRGKVGNVNLFKIGLEVGTDDPYFDPYNTFDEVVELNLTWMMAHEIAHGWSPATEEYKVRIGNVIRSKDLETKSIEKVTEEIELSEMNNSSGLTDLASALDEGFAIFIETQVANGQIKDCMDMRLKKKMIEARRNIYDRHLVRTSISPYYEGFYNIVRKLRQKVKTVSEMIELYKLIDFGKCSQIAIEDDNGMDETDGYKFVKDPSIIPLIVSEDNRCDSIGEYFRTR